MTMTTYIAGPMSPESFGLDETPDTWDWNHPQFNYVAGIYRTAGHAVLNPADNSAGEGDWDYYLRQAIQMLVKCDHIVMLPGWENSRGARLEHHIAVELGMEITYMEAQ